MAEYGLVACLLLCLIIVSGARSWILYVQLSRGVMPIALSIGLVSGLMYSCVSQVFTTPTSQVFALLVMGYMLGSIHRHFKGGQVVWWHTSIIPLMSLLMLYLWFMVCPSFGELVTKSIQWYVEHPNEPCHPRFWVQGMIGHWY